MSDQLPPCPECKSEYSYAMGALLGSSNTLKVGTKVRGIRLVDGPGDHDIEAKVDGFGPMNLKSSIVRKA